MPCTMNYTHVSDHLDDVGIPVRVRLLCPAALGQEGADLVVGQESLLLRIVTSQPRALASRPYTPQTHRGLTHST